MTATDHSWQLLQLAELVREIERHQDRAITILHQVQPDVRPRFALTLKRAQVENLRYEIGELTQLADQADALMEAVPREAIPITYDDLGASAKQTLRAPSTIDPAAVLLAAQVLDREAGLHALASGLRASDIYTTWEQTTVGSLLGSFRGVSPQLARRIATAAGLAPGTVIAGCDPDAIAQLAEQLDQHAKG